MKKQVTYLFGAGASANALPTVKVFNKRLENFLRFLEKIQNDKGEEFFPDLINGIYELLAECRNHSTIDTVAKKYFHSYQNSKRNLEKLKKILSIFFFYEQTFQDVFEQSESIMENQTIDSIKYQKSGNVDGRYDAFIASLLSPQENIYELPKNVNILTWNYDCQFELAFKNFLDESMYEIQQHLNVFPFLIGHNEHWNKLHTDNFKILHLNGQAHNFFKERVNSEKYLSAYDYTLRLKCGDPTSEIMKYFFDVLKTYIKFIDTKNLTFSWERNSSNSIQYDEISKIIKAASEIIDKTDVLVINGYSFPFFNRIVDRELIFKKEFKKIYIQDINAANIKTQLINIFEPRINEADIVEYKDVSQFILPPEFDGDFPEPVNLPMGAYPRRNNNRY